MAETFADVILDELAYHIIAINKTGESEPSNTTIGVPLGKSSLRFGIFCYWSIFSDVIIREAGNQAEKYSAVGK